MSGDQKKLFWLKGGNKVICVRTGPEEIDTMKGHGRVLLRNYIQAHPNQFQGLSVDSFRVFKITRTTDRDGVIATLTLPDQIKVT